MNKPNKEVKILPKITKFCMTIGQLPASYFMSMTYMEQVTWLCHYLENTVIPALNQNGEAVQELQNLYIQLKDYVDNYFDNLDLQEEVDNKLDEMAESGELSDIINNYDKMYVIAPKFNADEISSNYTILKNQGKNILIDSSYSNNWNNLKDMLDSNGVDHIDCFILSHYDADHAGNFTNNNLMEYGYIDSTTKLYLPTENESVSQAKITQIKNICTNYDLLYNTPYEGEVYNIANIKITFTNCDVAQINAYYDNPSNANEYSTICIIEHKDNKLLFEADADNDSFSLMKENNVIKGSIDFMLIPHHGVNPTTNEEYLLQLNPKIAIQEAGSRDFANCLFTACPSITTLYNLGCKIIPTFIQDDYIVIESNGYDLKIQQGQIFDTSSYLDDSTTIYVDCNINNANPQLGTYDNPFKQLNQALSTLQNVNYNVINIQLADGDYNEDLGITPSYDRANNILQYFNKTIVIKGNSSDNTAVTIKSLLCRNVKNLIVQNLTIKNDYFSAVEAYNSNIYVNNCIVTNTNEELTHDAFYCNNGRMFVNNTTINYANNVFNGNNSYIIAREISVNQFNYLYQQIERFNIKIVTITFIDETKQYDQLNMFNSYKGIRQIYANESTSSIGSDDTEVTMPINVVDGIKNLKVCLSSSSKNNVIVDCRYPANNKHYPFQITLESATKIYLIGGQIDFNDNKILISNQYQVTITRSDGTMTFSTHNDFYYFRIISVFVDDNY